MNREEALRANKKGAIAALLWGLMSAATVVLALSVESDGLLSYWSDPAYFFDVAIIFLCAFGMYRNSRVAALFIVAYFIASKVVFTIESGQFSSGLVALIFLYFFARAIQGTFVFHRLQKAENPDYKAAPKWAVYTGIPIIAIFSLMVGFGFLTMTSVFPSTEVQYRSEISAKDIETLKEAGIIYGDDTVDYFYSFGTTSILQGGNILTDDRVIVYFPDDEGQIAIYELYFGDIASVEKIEEGGVFSPSLYRVNGFDSEAWLVLELSTERRGDARFVQAIQDRLDRAGGL